MIEKLTPTEELIIKTFNDMKESGKYGFEGTFGGLVKHCKLVDEHLDLEEGRTYSTLAKRNRIRDQHKTPKSYAA